eukprot:CAMPEP_0205932734 /NCGR_PEP_ID=MMETSP1325-20131115/30881_1 /ASSEMBLY_ACC=CAM_ASM_000708 /TAXON_ID=236786 /ORGANISM="Florenciella sp., Strain RCC1007" /LENGTH=94 /DNA_ID=CAMNT_0053302485 /DNA_START=68 /DNA_END=352 /DNA_ORIENTATION=-
MPGCGLAGGAPGGFRRGRRKDEVYEPGVATHWSEDSSGSRSVGSPDDGPGTVKNVVGPPPSSDRPRLGRVYRGSPGRMGPPGGGAGKMPWQSEG